jgi:hypothetical protein
MAEILIKIILEELMKNVLYPKRIIRYIELLNWIDEDKLNWNMLSYNPNAIHNLEQNQDKFIGNIYQVTRMQFTYLN